MKASRRIAWLVTVVAIPCLAACAARPAAPGPAPSVIVGLEGRFAAASRERGARSAFLEFLGEDSIVLQPGPVFGRAAWEAAEEMPGTLAWAPDWAEMAADGAFGFSTGPWLLTPPEGGPAVAEGRYLTVWRQSAGTWRVVFDGGFVRRPGETPLRLDVTPKLGVAGCEPGPPAPAQVLQDLDGSLSGDAFEPHAIRATARLASTAAVFHPPRAEGAFDPALREAALGALPDTTQLWPMGGAVASLGDLGYTYGLSAPVLAAEANAAYVHVWCRVDGDWRLLVSLRTPLPQ